MNTSASASSLLTRLASLRKNADTGIVSECRQPTPLATFLRIYDKAGKECYIDYMQGAKALHKYLSPIEIPIIGEYLLPTRVPALFHAYEVVELAKVLAAEQVNDTARVDYIVKLIVHLTCGDYS